MLKFTLPVWCSVHGAMVKGDTQTGRRSMSNHWYFVCLSLKIDIKMPVPVTSLRCHFGEIVNKSKLNT